jgi:hypothetical protein
MPPSSKCSLPRPVANATGIGAAWPYPWDPPISAPCAPHVTSAVFSHRHVVLQATIVRALIGEQGWDVCSCDKPWIYSFILVEAVANAIFLFWQYLVAQFESLCINSKLEWANREYKWVETCQETATSSCNVRLLRRIMEPLLKKHPPIIPLQLWHVKFKISDSCRKEKESTLDLAKG